MYLSCPSSPPSLFSLSFFLSYFKPNLVDPIFRAYQTDAYVSLFERDLCMHPFSFFSPLPSLVYFYRSAEYGRITERARIYNNLITFPPCRYRDNNYALMARGWNDIMHPLKARKRHCFDASVSH